MKRTHTKWILGPALAVGLVLGGPQPVVRAAAPADAGKAARQVSVNFVKTEIVDVLKALAMQTGSNIVAGPEVKGEINISMKEVDLEQALQLVTRLNSLSYREVNGTYVVTTPARMKELYPTSNITQVYTVTSLKPADAVLALKGMAPGVGVAAQGTSLVVLTGTPEDVVNAKNMLAQMEGANASTNGQRETVTYELHYLNVLEATRTLASLVPEVMVTPGPGRRLPGDGSIGSIANGTTEVKYDATQRQMNVDVNKPGEELKSESITFTPGEDPTTVLLTGYPVGIARALDILKEIDTAPRQVEITARVVDLGEGDALKLGLRYNPLPTGIAESQIPSDEPWGGYASSSPGHLLSFGQFARLPIKIGIDYQFDQMLSHSKILANPRVSAIDGRAARIFIGQTLTYVISQNVDRTTGLTTYQTETQHIGITLLSIPKISADGTITLEVHPTVSNLLALEEYDGIVLPRIAERSVDTTIRVKDGETIAIGGLLREEEIKTMNQVPFLSQIPIFGELFKYRNNVKNKSDLTIFITTKIVPNSQP
jgi:type II secretory pathway component GspD/PulD (secretin)